MLINAIEPQIDESTVEIRFRGKSVNIAPKGLLFYFKTFNENNESTIDNPLNSRMNELALLVNKVPSSTRYEYSWCRLTDGPLGYQNLSTKVIGSSLGTHVKQRNIRLCKKLKKIIDISESEISEFLEELGLFMEEHEENLFVPPEEDAPEPELPNFPESFDDYPEPIQQKAIEIIEDGKVLETLTTVIGRAHEGDKQEIELLIYGLLTNRIKDTEQVHIKIGGTTGVGKTHLIKTVLKIVPERFVLETNSFSPKWLYHTNDLREDCNCILIDDYGDIGDPATLRGLLKDIMDTTKAIVTHSTIIDGKAVTFEVAGKNIYFLTAAADISNIEIERRCLNLNPNESKIHEKAVKKHVIDEVIAKDSSLDRGFLLCRAIFDKLTENAYKVFNPFIKLIETDTLGSTDIKMFAAFVKARALIFKNQREETDDGILLGTKEDVEVIQGLWNHIGGLQRYNISKKQMQMLKDLKVYDENLHENKVEIGALKDDSIKGSTYKELAAKYNVSKPTVRKWVKGNENKNEVNPKPSLEDLGFVIIKSSDPSKDRAESWIYLNPKKEIEVEGWKLDKEVNKLDTKPMCAPIDGVLGKISVISSYLMVNNKLQIYKASILNHQKIKALPKGIKTDDEVKNILQTVNTIIRELPDDDLDEEEACNIYLDSLLSPNVHRLKSSENSDLAESELISQPQEENNQHIHHESKKEEHISNIQSDIGSNEVLSLVYAPNDSLTLERDYNAVDRAILIRLEALGDITKGDLITDWASYYGFPMNEVKASIIKLLDKGNIERRPDE